MERLNLKTKPNTEFNLEALYQICPACFTETRDKKTGELRRVVDFDKLKSFLGEDVAEDINESYEFTWVGKQEARREAAKPITKTLRPCIEESVDWDTTKNLYIEGDNLEVLKLLQNSYMGKVKMIYIDPPYNTGNDFIYHDDFTQDRSEYDLDVGNVDEEGNRFRKNAEMNGRFHSDWCSMIYSRLLLARNYLKKNGVIFVSIDDCELCNLKRLLDEVFGEKNFVFQICWRRTDNQPNIGNCARVKEYILCYAKDKNSLKLGKLPLSEKAKKEYRYSDEKGLFRRSILLHKTRGRKTYSKKTKSGNVLNGPWMVSEEEFNRMDANGEIYWTSGGDEQPYGKIYLSNSKGQIPNDFWGIEYGTNQRASLELEALFGKRYFSFPKPVTLITNLLSIGSDKDSIVMDFFSGSATTAHAVMKLNSEDLGSRSFIMVQLPELVSKDNEASKDGYPTICEIGKQRIRLAGKKIKQEQEIASNNLDIGFRVFKCDESNMKDVCFEPKDLKLNWYENSGQ